MKTLRHCCLQMQHRAERCAAASGPETNATMKVLRAQADERRRQERLDREYEREYFAEQERERQRKAGELGQKRLGRARLVVPWLA